MFLLYWIWQWIFSYFIWTFRSPQWKEMMNYKNTLLSLSKNKKKTFLLLLLQRVFKGKSKISFFHSSSFTVKVIFLSTQCKHKQSKSLQRWKRIFQVIKSCWERFIIFYTLSILLLSSQLIIYIRSSDGANYDAEKLSVFSVRRKHDV